MNTRINEAVTRGVTLLDAKRPGWAQRIDVSILNIASSRMCIVGQLYDGDFSEGLEQLGIGTGSGSYGFGAVCNLEGDGECTCLKSLGLLKDAWIYAIAERMINANTETRQETFEEVSTAFEELEVGA